MKSNKLLYESFVPFGKVTINMVNDEIIVKASTSAKSKGRDFAKQCVDLGKYRLPFRIDMTIKVETNNEYPIFNIMAGNGYLSLMNGNPKRTDILTGENKPITYIFDNSMPTGEYVDISVMYGTEIMWVCVNGEYRYHDKNAPYQRLLRNGADSEIGLAVNCSSKKTLLYIKTAEVTEYASDEPEIPEELMDVKELSPLEIHTQNMPPETQREIMITNEYLMNDMKRILKFKRTIDKYGNLTYSSANFRYKLRPYVSGQLHDIIWTKEPNGIVITLEKLAETDKAFADKTFGRIRTHIVQRVCPKCRFMDCHNPRSYEFNGATKRTCGSAIQFDWEPDDFAEVRRVISAIAEISQ